jgi:hypothetical protein
MSAPIVLCGKCRWWGEEIARAPMSVRACTHPMVCHPGNHGGERDMRLDGVLTADEGGATGDLMTGPDFGCIHGEVAS